MKSINVEFTDEEFAKLASHKAFLMLNWHDYILALMEHARKTNYSQKTKKV